MKRFAVCTVLLLGFLCGCSDTDGQLQRGFALREALMQQACSFTSEITAVYGDMTYTFTAQCSADRNGDLSFSVVKPDSIAGITGTVTESGGRLTFDDKALAFSLLADGEVSPVSAPWLVIKTLRSGFLRSCCEDDSGLRLTIDDSYEDNALCLDIWLGREDLPIFAQILWQGRRVLSVQIENFNFV